MVDEPIIGRTVAMACFMALVTACASQRTTPPHSALRDSAPVSAYETETATPAPPTGAHPVPPEIPCVYPADDPPAAWDPGFVGVLQESDVVVEADIEDKFQQLGQDGDQVFWSQLLDNVDVLRSRATPAPTVVGLDAQGDPGEPPYAWPTGRYVLLLLAPRNGLSSPSDGMFGMFRIVDGHALRFCPNYDDPAHPIAASGTPPTVEQLLALIPPELPSDIVSPKPGAATVSPAMSSS
ncbi:MAG TPA: hypothetical protein VGD55_00260 [Acidothermaceae bacterium]